MFFPSYGFMNKIHKCWESTNLISALSKDKSSNGAQIFMEPKDAKVQEGMLKLFYKCIDGGRKAVLLAVCRGKVSEGINFADDYARCIMLIGVPYPSTVDLCINLKRKYQDDKIAACVKSNHGIINGSDWYKLQAFRAINQALGRCIRHRLDYGALILCDPRYHSPSTHQQLSRWIRPAVVNVNNFEENIIAFKLFFDRQTSSFGKVPEKTYKGSFNVRVSPDLHRDAALVAIQKNVSLNDFVKNAISYAIKHTNVVKGEIAP